MQGGKDNPIGEGPPLAPDDAEPADDATPAIDDEGGSGAPPTPDVATPESGTVHAAPWSPSLPLNEAKRSPAMVASTVTPTRGAETWYRTDQDRFKSVHRRANPWYRRVARGIIGMAFVAAAGIGLFYGARLVQDYLDRDRLPDIGAEVPTIRATSFEIRSTSPAPVLDGTLVLDAETKAFEFTGRGTGIQAGTQVVSPDGTITYVRRGSGAWQTAGAGDQVVADVLRAVAYLADDDTADDILTSRLRRGYVELLDRVEIGEGDDELRRFEMRLDTSSFRDEFPLQYQSFEDRAIPGVTPVRGLLVTITLDDNQVLVGVDDAGTNWSWQRLTYTDQPFRPIDPANDLLDGTIEITDGNVDG